MRSPLLAVSMAALLIPAAALAQTAPAQTMPGHSTPMPAPGHTMMPAPGTTVIIPPVEPPPGAPALGLPNSAGDIPRPGMLSSPVTASTAAEFVRDAGGGGLFEVEAGRVAESRAQNDAVRAFGQRMQQDHTAVNRELVALAQAQGIGTALMPDASHQNQLQSLRTMPLSRFDHSYLAGQIKAHQETIALFEMVAASSAPDMAPFKPFAEKTLPALREHLAMAQSLFGTGTPTAAR
ncbi:putative membrane protein [Azospirillum fermentarium]|uniref:DUF4142 domain-containing protein n=1 Tax=Azospirillum fermentarium TaxID=1233114 RepID=UPI002225E153|nr:DUF4142 domain-containing protein [Azospirillum fermentarium]MCW2244512.1 putative membrane protein [Azospirillum fermentarium]